MSSTDIIIIILTLVTAVLTGFSVWVALMQNKRARYEERQSNLEKAFDALTINRSEYTAAAMKLYRERYADAADCSDFREHGHLVYRNGWVDCKDNNGEFPALRDIEIAISAKKYAAPSCGENPKLPDAKESYANNVKFHLKKLLTDLPLYGLDSVDASCLIPKITVKLGSYFDFYNTCEYLGYEMAYARRIEGKKGALSADSLPCRFGKGTKVLDVFDTGNRFAGLGINTVTVLHNVLDDGDKPGSFFLLHKRSQKVAEGIGSYHVIPAGSYQPAGDETDVAPETMEITVLREFGEEICGYDEFFDLKAPALLEGKMLDKLEPVFLGIGFEPLNTKAEVLSALIIDLNEPEYRQLFGGQQSVAGLKEFFKDEEQSNYEGKITLCPLNESTLEHYEKDRRTTASMKEIMRLMQLPENRDFFGIEE